MLDKLPKLWLLALVPIFALAFIIWGIFFYYGGSYQAPPSLPLPIEKINRVEASRGDFTYTPGMALRRGVLLVDAAHSNGFARGELVTLLSQVSDQGYDVKYVTSSLGEELRGADSLLVVSPRSSYTPVEAGQVERFVEKGGRVILIADPTRLHDINSLARRFGLDFQPDYLFNQVDHDLNFRDILVRDFRPNELTRGLEEIVLYTAGSIRTSGTGLAVTDQNTRSSMVGNVEPRYPIALGRDGKVLAIFDLTFMIPPQNTIADNGQLVSNLAEYLTTGHREFELADFPSFLQGDVDVLLGEPDLFDLGTQVRSGLAGMGVDSRLASTEDAARDTVFLGLYQDAPQVAGYLEGAGVEVGETVGVPSAAGITPEGTSVILLSRSQDRHVLVLLAQSAEGLREAVKLLFSGDFRSGLVDESVGVYKTE